MGLRGHTRENHVVSQNQGRRGSANLNHTGSVHPLASTILHHMFKKITVFLEQIIEVTEK